MVQIYELYTEFTTCSSMYLNVLLAYKEGLVTEETIDKPVTRLITTRLKLGMFDSPEKVPFSNIPYEKNDCKEHTNLIQK